MGSSESESLKTLEFLSPSFKKVVILPGVYDEQTHIQDNGGSTPELMGHF
jgi:hypothetical protein